MAELKELLERAERGVPSRDGVRGVPDADLAQGVLRAMGECDEAHHAMLASGTYEITRRWLALLVAGHFERDGFWVPERALIAAEAKLSALEGEFAVFRNEYVRLQQEQQELARERESAKAWTDQLAARRAVAGARVLACNGHVFPLRARQVEPDEVAHCLRCGVSYAGTGPTMSEPCPVGTCESPDVETRWAPKTLEEWGKENFSPGFLVEAEAEYRHVHIAAEDHDLCWLDGVLPGWEFYRRTGGGCYVGIDEETGDSVEGPTEEAVYQAAVDLDMQRVEEMFEGAGDEDEEGA